MWRNGRIPVVYKPPGKRPLLVRCPYAKGNAYWLRGPTTNHRVRWDEQHVAWEVPRSRFDNIVRLCLDRYGEVYVIQTFRPLETCAPACWDAKGHDCECSCMGANHGSGRSLAHVVSGTFAFEWGRSELACRHLRSTT